MHLSATVESCCQKRIKGKTKHNKLKEKGKYLYIKKTPKLLMDLGSNF